MPDSTSSPLILQAAHSAAVADGVAPPPLPPPITTSASPILPSSCKPTNTAPVPTAAAPTAVPANSTATATTPAVSTAPKVATTTTTATAAATTTTATSARAPSRVAQHASMAAPAPAAPAPAATTTTHLRTTATTTTTSIRAPPAHHHVKPPPVKTTYSGPTTYAAAASTTSRKTTSGGKKKGPPLRRGKWTPEEEAYANRLISEFKSGLLPLTDGTTLRTFLSKLLNCDPMRISKKFVGSNCIGKQVFRRRTADINRLNPEQMQTSRDELCDLERRFLDRVAQTNRVKSSASSSSSGAGTASMGDYRFHGYGRDDELSAPPSPPWLRPPVGYKQGQGAAMAAAALSQNADKGPPPQAPLLSSSLPATGRSLQPRFAALPKKDQHQEEEKKSGESKHNELTSPSSVGLLDLANQGNGESRSSFAALFNNSNNDDDDDNKNRNNASNNPKKSTSASILEELAGHGNDNGTGESSSSGLLMSSCNSLSAARLAAAAAVGSCSSNSLSNLLSSASASTLNNDNTTGGIGNHHHLSQLAREAGVSSASLAMMDRKSSFEALMSLDLQSLQSIDNLASLIQSTGATIGNNNNITQGDTAMPDISTSTDNAGSLSKTTSNDFSNARRLASVGRMESLLRSLSNSNISKNNNHNVAGGLAAAGGTGSTSMANFMKSMQGAGGSVGAGLAGLASSNSLHLAAAAFTDDVDVNDNNNSNLAPRHPHETVYNEATSLSAMATPPVAVGNVEAAITTEQKAARLANMMFRNESTTGLSALRSGNDSSSNGDNNNNAHRTTSVDDFLSLVAAGDIPHQDPSMLNVPLLQQQQQQQQHLPTATPPLDGKHPGSSIATSSNGSALNLLRSVSTNKLSSMSNLSDLGLSKTGSGVSILVQPANSSSSLKRKQVENADDAAQQGSTKR